MTWLAIGIAAVLLLLVFLVLWLSPNNERPKSTVPGMLPSSDKDGNMLDIGKAGGLHLFLMGLHKKFGPIASFWWGKEYAVSIGSAELFKQHQHCFDRPVEQFRAFGALITPHSIQYANGADGKSRRQAFDTVFNYENLDIYYDSLQKNANQIVGKWANGAKDDHFPLGEHMFLFSLKSSLTALMGNTFRDDEELMDFKRSYDFVWGDLEQIMTNPTQQENRISAQNFKRSVAIMREIITYVIKERQLHGKDSPDFLLIDAIIGYHSDEEPRFADTLTYLLGSFHTTANLLTWCVYFLCMHEDVQERLYQEVIDVLGPTDNVTHQSIGKLKYMHQVLDESLRRGVVGPWAARYSDEDVMLGGHKIYARTPVIQALGVAMMDENFWPNPTVFDPDRFSEKRSKGRPAIAFSPFGFAGHRQCPGYRFTYVEATILLVTAIQKFKFMLVPGQDVKPHYGLVTHPKEEIWFKVARRV